MGTNLMSLAQSGGKFLKLYGDRKMVRTLPYDAEVEYLESTGTQYLDTLVTGGSVAGYEIKFVYIGSNNGWPQFFCGPLIDDSPIPKLYGHNGDVYSGSAYLSDGIILNGILNVPIVASVDGNVLYANEKSFSLGGNGGWGELSWWVFNSHSEPTLHSKMRLYYLKMSKDGSFVRDFIPVRFTNSLGVSEGAMYDRVSGQLFRNAGTGAFAIGPDKTI